MQGHWHEREELDGAGSTGRGHIGRISETLPLLPKDAVHGKLMHLKSGKALIELHEKQVWISSNLGFLYRPM